MAAGEALERGRVRVGAPDPQAELRRRYVAACAAHDRAVACLGLRDAPSIDFRLFTDLTCGARGKRTGRPCPQRGLYSNGRCKWHGGASTGPKTPEGKARAMLNHKKGRGMTSEALEGREIAERVEAGALGVSVAAAHEDADVPLLPAGVEDAVGQAPADSVCRSGPAADDSKAEPAADPRYTPRSPEGLPEAPARIRPLQAIRACLAARQGRPMTPSRIGAVTKLDVDMIESALRLLVSMRQVERRATVAGPAGYMLSQATR